MAAIKVPQKMLNSVSKTFLFFLREKVEMFFYEVEFKFFFPARVVNFFISHF